MSQPRQRSAQGPKRARIRQGEAKPGDPKEEEDDDCCLLPSVAVVLAQNGWIGARDIGRLGLTCRGATWGDGEIWTALCHRRWANSADVPQRLVRALGGYRSLYRHRSTSLLSATAKKPGQSPLPPPTLKPNQFSILVDIFVAGENACSDVLTGTQLMDNLLKKGYASFEIKKPFVLGNASCWMSDAEECTCKRRCRFDLDIVDGCDARMHLLRSTDNASCCVFDPKEGGAWVDYASFDPIGDPKDGLFDWKNSEEARVSLTPDQPKGLTFRQTGTAGEIVGRLLGKRVSFGFEFFVGLVEPGDKVGITGFQVNVYVWDVFDYEHELVRKYFTFDEKMSKKTGVTVLHLLDQLQGVQFNPTLSLPD